MEDQVDIKLEKARPKTPAVDIHAILPPGKAAAAKAQQEAEVAKSTWQDTCIFYAKLLLAGALGGFLLHKGFFYLKNQLQTNGKLPDLIPPEVLSSSDAFIPLPRGR